MEKNYTLTRKTNRALQVLLVIAGLMVFNQHVAMAQATRLALSAISNNQVAGQYFSVTIFIQKQNGTSATYSGTVRLASNPAGLEVTDVSFSNVDQRTVQVRFLSNATPGNYTITASTPSPPNAANNLLTAATSNSFSVMSPLPVELSAFVAQVKERDVQLKWTTASEKDNLGFEVQASVNGTEFTKLDFVQSRNGNSRSEQHYAYTDTREISGNILYYRLRQIDTDGTEAFSPVVAVKLRAGKPEVATYPNPFTDGFTVSLNLAKAEKVQVRVYDVAGKEVMSVAHLLAEGVNVLPVKLHEHTGSGVYFLEVAGEQTNFRTSLLRQ